MMFYQRPFLKPKENLKSRGMRFHIVVPLIWWKKVEEGVRLVLDQASSMDLHIAHCCLLFLSLVLRSISPLSFFSTVLTISNPSPYPTTFIFLQPTSLVRITFSNLYLMKIVQSCTTVVTGIVDFTEFSHWHHVQAFSCTVTWQKVVAGLSFKDELMAVKILTGLTLLKTNSLVNTLQRFFCIIYLMDEDINFTTIATYLTHSSNIVPSLLWWKLSRFLFKWH